MGAEKIYFLNFTGLFWFTPFYIGIAIGLECLVLQMPTYRNYLFDIHIDIITLKQLPQAREGCGSALLLFGRLIRASSIILSQDTRV